MPDVHPVTIQNCHSASQHDSYESNSLSQTLGAMLAWGTILDELDLGGD